MLAVCAEAEASDVVGWVTSAVQCRLTSPDQLSQALDRRQQQPHRRLIRSLVAAEGAESPVEVRYLNDVERAHGLSRGRRQAASRDGGSERDVHDDEQQLIVELDGRLGHEGMGRFRDMWRDHVASVEGRATLRYGSLDLVQRPCEIAFQVAQILRSLAGPARRAV